MMVGYDVAAEDMSEDGGVRPRLVPGEDDTSSDAGSTRIDAGTSDGLASSPLQSSDAGSTETAVDKGNLCGLSSWLPGLIPDLSVIPNIPGITIACTNADAGVATKVDAGVAIKADAGTRDAGTSADAGPQDAAIHAGSDGGRDASASDAGADAAAYDASADARAASGDAGGS